MQTKHTAHDCSSHSHHPRVASIPAYKQPCKPCTAVKNTAPHLPPPRLIGLSNHGVMSRIAWPPYGGSSCALRCCGVRSKIPESVSFTQPQAHKHVLQNRARPNSIMHMGPGGVCYQPAVIHHKHVHIGIRMRNHNSLGIATETVENALAPGAPHVILLLGVSGAAAHFVSPT